MSKNQSSRRLTLVLSLLLVMLCAWNGLLYAHQLQTSDWNFLFNAAVAIFYIFAFIIALWRSRQSQVPELSRRILTYLGLGALSWGIGSLIWTYYNLILHVSIPYPSYADIFFLTSYPLFGLALWSLHESYGSQATQKVIRESILIVIISAVVIFAFLNRPDLSPDLGLTKNLLNVAYSLGDVLLVAVAIIELRGGQAQKHRGLYLLIGFLLLQASGDFIFAYRNNAGVYWNGDISDLLFGFSAFVLALAVAQNDLVRHNKRQ